MSAGAFMSEKFFGKEAVIHKETKWAKQIISMQRRDGAWGDFHTLSVFSTLLCLLSELFKDGNGSVLYGSNMVKGEERRESRMDPLSCLWK